MCELTETDFQEYLASFKRTLCQCCYWSVRTCIYTYSTIVLTVVTSDCGQEIVGDPARVALRCRGDGGSEIVPLCTVDEPHNLLLLSHIQLSVDLKAGLEPLALTLSPQLTHPMTDITAPRSTGRRWCSLCDGIACPCRKLCTSPLCLWTGETDQTE